MPVDGSLLDKIIAESTKRMKGNQRIHSGDAIEPVTRLPFDELELNLATFGGAGMGRVSRFWGSKSSCKSMIAWGLAKQGQQMRNDLFPNGMSVAYYNVEGVYDPRYVSRDLGVDITPGKLTIVEGAIIEDIARHINSLLYAVNIHIIDSASAAQSIHAFEGKQESQRPGLDGKAWSKAYKDIEENMDKNENIVIVIDQARANFKTGGEQVAGGYAADHASSLSLHSRAATKLYRVGGELVDTRPNTGNDPLSGTHRVDGREIEIEVEKSRICRPFGKARLTFDIDALAFDKIEQYRKAGLFLGVIQQSGSYFKIPTMEKSIQGNPKLKQHIAEDPFLVQMIEEAAQKFYREASYA